MDWCSFLKEREMKLKKCSVLKLIEEWKAVQESKIENLCKKHRTKPNLLIYHLFCCQECTLVLSVKERDFLLEKLDKLVKMQKNP